eukprot:Nk52_evm43s296 gene=Nk52_evmTU43s296
MIPELQKALVCSLVLLWLHQLCSVDESFVISGNISNNNRGGTRSLDSETPRMSIKSRTVVKSMESIFQSEGVGARVRRSIGRPELKNLDPFLLLDEFHVSEPAGFPDHPHRGFETVTYMLKGSFMHEDFNGHAASINEGELQWMTAGRGIVHSEMPGKDGKTQIGLQLWVNLKSTEKMCKPGYQELLAKDIPKVSKDGVHATVIAGSALGTTSKVYTKTPTMYLDFTIDPDSELNQPIPEGWNGFVYTLEGEASFGEKGTEGKPHHTLVLSNEKGQSGLTVKTGKSPVHFVLICGQPLNEPVVQHGPFVMNSQDQIRQAMMDYSQRTNGFEKARNWSSKIAQ